MIKVRTIKHLKEELEKKYQIYLSRQTLSTYLLPRHANTFAAKRHHHPAQIAISSVARTEMKVHVDEHYCLASVKLAKTFAENFPDDSIIISQDDKAKIGLGIPAVGRTFKTVQSVNEPVTIADHDFPMSTKQKLIPLVYLLINPSDSSKTLRTGHMSIVVRPEYFVETSSRTYMADLIKIIHSKQFKETTKCEEKTKSIWVLIVDGGPDENLKHLKNIFEYSKLFKKEDLDYLTVRTHAPGQSAYNPVERSMATLSEKLAGISFPIDHFSSHLNSQGKVVDDDLAYKNFRYAGERLCDIWKRDLIHEKNIICEYIDQHSNPFEEENDFEPTWSWIEKHAQLCWYSLDL